MFCGGPGWNFTNTSCWPVTLSMDLLKAFQLFSPVALRVICANNLPVNKSSSHTSSCPCVLAIAVISNHEGAGLLNSTPDIINHPPYFEVLVTTMPASPVNVVTP